MMIIDPVTLGDVSCTRASTATYYDRNGALQTAPANTLRVTYDPSDLTKAPYALVELVAATNLITYSAKFDLGTWSRTRGSFVSSAKAAPDGSTAYYFKGDGTGSSYVYQPVTLVAGQAYAFSCYVCAADYTGVFQLHDFTDGSSIYLDLSSGIATGDASITSPIAKNVGNGWYRLSGVFTAVTSGVHNLGLGVFTASSGVYVYGAQVETDKLTRYIPTGATTATRAADVIAPGAGLVYSNVPITETPYSSASTYAKDAVVYDPATYLTYQSFIANNIGHALTDTASWTPLLKVVNRWLMLDQYNNTQTSNPEEIIIVLSPQAIAQGLYLGNVDASEIRISVVDPTDGLVYQEVQSLVVSNSASSYFNWFFKRIKRKSYAVSVLLPPYFNALVTIAIKKPGSTPKCGMCVLGALVDVGLSQYGLSREIKDYSTVNFNFDGTSNVVLRNFAKIMDVDVVLQNDQIDSVIETLEGYRQKPLVWIGAVQYGSACLFGTYTSFKNIIPYPNESTMNLQIQGTV